MAETEAKARVALITGGASGIGCATGRRLLASGWKVAIVDRDRKALEAQGWRPGDSANVFSACLDVTDTKSGYMTGAVVPVDGGFSGAGIIAD